MTTGLYAEGKKAILRGCDMVTGDIRAILVNDSYVPVLASHQYLSQVSAYKVGNAAAISGRSLTQATNKVALAIGPTTFPSVPALLTGGSVAGVILYLHTGVAGTSSLIAYFGSSYFAGLYLNPDGRDVVATWPSDDNGVFSL